MIVSSIKPKWEQRINKGRAESKKGIISIKKIKEILSKCLKNQEIDRTILHFTNLSCINYSKIQEDNKTNAIGHIIWLQFTKQGHIAVVGAGKDIGFPIKSKSGTAFILNELNLEWDKSNIIVIAIKGLDHQSVGLKNIKEFNNNILKCRNGIEHYIGDYLISKNIPIINFYQHKNYSENFWNNCINQNYIYK